jgi:hypothetical protein
MVATSQLQGSVNVPDYGYHPVNPLHCGTQSFGKTQVKGIYDAHRRP